MSAARRTKAPPPPESPRGYRSTRRGSRALKQAKKAEKQHRIVTAVQRTSRRAKNTAIVAAQTIAVLTFSVLVLLLAALLINNAVRWNARRLATIEKGPTERERRAQENVVVIGADGDKAVGFLAMRVDQKGKQVYGVAIPDGAFIDVPGQGFARIGEAYSAGPEAVVSAISNFLTVPFRSWIVVPSAVYRDALTRQVVKGVAAGAVQSDLDDADLRALEKAFAATPQKNVALVPLPVKPIKLGDQTYFEPQRDDVADLLKSWWNVDPTDNERVTRAVVYNGAGKPGVAGEAAQQLIRAGIRVVDTQNADNFNYAKTQIIVRRGDDKTGESIRSVLGVGTVNVVPSNENVTDVVIIIGKDYRPPAPEKKKGT